MGNKSTIDFWSKQSDEYIIKSLNDGPQPMLIQRDPNSEEGYRIMNGNTRYSILRSRGADLSGLKPQILPSVTPMEAIEPEEIP